MLSVEYLYPELRLLVKEATSESWLSLITMDLLLAKDLQTNL